MYERSYGYRYEEGERLSTTEIAKLIRKEIKMAIGEGLLPKRWKYSVTSEYFANGSSIDVRVKDCADAWMPCPGYRVGTRRELPGGGYTATACGDPWCKAGGEHKDKPGAQEHEVLTEEARVAKMTLERIHGAFNHDGSEIQIDYFDVNYYGHVEFQSAESARWEAEHKAERAARRAALDAAAVTCHVAVYGRDGRVRTVHAAGEVDGRTVLICGARPWGRGLAGKTERAVTCSRCVKRTEGGK